MQSVGQQLIIAAIPVLPLLVFFVLVLFGRYLKEGAQYVAIFGVATSLVFSAFALLDIGAFCRDHHVLASDGNHLVYGHLRGGPGRVYWGITLYGGGGAGLRGRHRQE